MDRSIDSCLFRMSWRIMFISVILILISAGSASAATSVNSCQTISSPDVYVLTTNIMNSGTCITIESSDVVFDGAGYTINGTGDFGVYVYDASTTLTNVTVKNLKVANWSYGIFYQNTENGRIENNTASLNNSAGIALINSNNTILSSS